jgi:hypothetical protein
VERVDRHDGFDIVRSRFLFRDLGKRRPEQVAATR